MEKQKEQPAKSFSEQEAEFYARWAEETILAEFEEITSSEGRTIN